MCEKFYLIEKDILSIVCGIFQSKLLKGAIWRDTVFCTELLPKFSADYFFFNTQSDQVELKDDLDCRIVPLVT